MCKIDNNKCFYDYNSTLSPEGIVLAEAIPYINANREEKDRVSLEELLEALQNGSEDVIVTDTTEPEVIIEDESVEENTETVIEDTIEEEQEEIIQAEESEENCNHDIKFDILMSILNRTYAPTEYKEEDIHILRELYKSSENDYVKQLLKETLLKLVYETI